MGIGLIAVRGNESGSRERRLQANEYSLGNMVALLIGTKGEPAPRRRTVWPPRCALLGVFDAEVDLVDSLLDIVDSADAVSALVGLRVLKVDERRLEIGSRILHVHLCAERRSSAECYEE
jgi:hypothetical protein